MNLSKKYIGYWWIPSNSESKVTGTLYIDLQNDIKLETIGCLSDYSLDKFEVLLGDVLEEKTGHRTFITLVEVLRRKNTQNGLSISVYSSSKAILTDSFSYNKHFINKDNITFTSLAVNFDLVNAWLKNSPFHSSRYPQEEFILKYTSPPKITIDIDSLNINLNIEYGLRQNSTHLKHELEHKSWLVLKPDRPQSLDWYLDKVYSLQIFLSIMTGFSVSVIELTGCGNDICIEQITYKGKKEKYEIFLSSLNSSQNNYQKTPDQFLICLSCLDNNINNIVQKWFEKADILEPAVKLYFALLSTPKLHTEFKIVNYLQALEALHRLAFGGVYVSEEDYEPIYQDLIAKIPNNLDRDHRNALKNRIKYGYQFSQRKRIKELLEEVWEGCLDNFIDNKKFISKVVDIRNELTHWDKTSTYQAVAGEELFYMAERLKVLLLTHILLQLDIPREVVYKSVTTFSEFNYLKIQK